MLGSAWMGHQGAENRQHAHLGEHLVRSRTAACWEWTRTAYVDGGAIFETTHERSPARLDVAGRLRPAPLDPGQTRPGREARFQARQPMTDERRATSRRCPGPRTSRPASAEQAGRSARNTASRTTRRARTRSLGSWDRGTCSAAAPPGARRLRTRRCWDGTTALQLSGRAGAGRAPPPMGPLGEPPGEGGDDRVRAGREGQEGSNPPPAHRR